MRMLPLTQAAFVAALLCAPAFAQEWTHFTGKEDGFSSNYPGAPKVETTTYATQFGQTLPARVYRAADPLGRYTTTVVDYRNIEKLHNERSAKCRAANGANFQDGDVCQNDYRMEVAGAMDYAAWNFMRRDGVKVTQYMFYVNEQVAGRLLQLTHVDQSRTHAVFHQHAGRLYIHEATVPPGMPEPILFMQSLGWVDDEGRTIRYRNIYAEGYGEWMFPHPPLPRTTRDLTTAIERPVDQK